MKTYFHRMSSIAGATVILSLAALQANASETSDAMLQAYQLSTQKPFSAQTGEALWRKTVNGQSCTTCHSESVTAAGKHSQTGKLIEPMAPSANPQRLTDSKKIEKWFLRNCKSTFNRECTIQEKGDILLWLSQQ